MEQGQASVNRKESLLEKKKIVGKHVQTQKVLTLTKDVVVQ